MQIKFVISGVILWFIFFLVSSLVIQFSLARYFYDIDYMLLAGLYAILTVSGSILVYHGIKSQKSANKQNRTLLRPT